MSRGQGSPRLVLVLAVAALVVGLLASGGAAAAPAGRKPVEVVTVKSGGHTYVLKVWTRKKAATCLPHAYGKPVRRFLRHHHCVGLTRYLVTTKVNGRGVGFAQSSLGFTAKTQTGMYEAAGKFRALVSKDGTGNFYSLFHDGYRLPRGPHSVPSPDAFNAQSQDNGVTIVDAWYLRGTTPANAKPLERMARNIYLQWS
jgi:hypothetical protein